MKKPLLSYKQHEPFSVIKNDGIILGELDKMTSYSEMLDELIEVREFLNTKILIEKERGNKPKRVIEMFKSINKTLEKAGCNEH